MILNQLQIRSESAQQPTDRNKLLNEKQAADFLQVSPGTLSVWRSTGRYSIPFIKIGRNVRYRLTDLSVWLETRTQANGATA